MKAILGIDTMGAYKPALDLIARLQFPKPELTLLHAAPTEAPIPLPDASVEAQYMKVVQSQGVSALEEASGLAKARSLKATTKLVMGRAADSIAKEANSSNADLVALCATHTVKRNRTFLGSATCALAIESTVPVLIAKRFIRRRSISALLAIDHSDGSDAWIKNFIRLAPRGISHLYVLTAFEIDDQTAAAAHTNLAHLGGDIERWLQDTLTEKTKLVSDQLGAAGFNTTVEVVQGSPEEVIHHAMMSHRADLLIIGALGNKREPGARIGSVALHQVVAEPYSVLVIR